MSTNENMPNSSGVNCLAAEEAASVEEGPLHDVVVVVNPKGRPAPSKRELVMKFLLFIIWYVLR